MKAIRWMTILAAATAAACGGPATPSATTGAAQAMAQSYQAVGQDMTTTVGHYQTSTATMPDLGACRTAEGEYAATMGPLIDRMRTLSGSMDHYMAGAMGTSWADMDCVAQAMAAEYERHRAVACGAPDVSVDQAEAAHHGTTMSGWIEHQRVRYEQMGEAMGITPPYDDSTWTCFHNPDGSFTMDGHTWTPAPPSGDPTPTTSPDPLPWPTPCGGSMCPCH